MRTLLLITLGLAILAVALSAKPKNKTRAVDKTSPPTDNTENKPAAKTDPADESKPAKKAQKTDAPKTGKKAAAKKSDNNQTAPSPAKPTKKGTGSAAKKQPSKIDIDIDDDIQDILAEDEDEEEEEAEEEDVEIPAAKDLDLSSDPIKLARRIKNLANLDTKKDLAAKLKQLWNKNKNTLSGRFYQSAYAALIDEKEALKFWNKQKKIATDNGSQEGSLLGDIANNGLLRGARSGIGEAVGTAQKIAAADPVGIALRRGESFALGVASDGAKNLGKFTDFAYDTVGNVSNFVKAATPFVDMIPFINIIKKNVHDFIDEKVKRGRYLAGTFADNASEALANASKDAADQADQRENMLRKVTSSRRLI